MSSRDDVEFELLEIDEDHAKARAFNMLFMVWRRRTLADAYGRSVALARELVAKFPEGMPSSRACSDGVRRPRRSQGSYDPCARSIASAIRERGARRVLEYAGAWRQNARRVEQILCDLEGRI